MNPWKHPAVPIGRLWVQAEIDLKEREGELQLLARQLRELSKPS
jgi:hypothetical protein